MEIQVRTKFNVGDYAFTLKDNKIVKINILSISVSVTDTIKVRYYIENYVSFNEDELYYTQGELIDAIKWHEDSEND